MRLEIIAATTIDGHGQGEEFECKDEKRAKRLIARMMCKTAPEKPKSARAKPTKEPADGHDS